MSTPLLTPHDHAQDIASHDYGRLNEADTRHRVIDRILHDVLCWPRSSVSCECYTKAGFADYVLIGRRGGHVLFIEAKKSGNYFTLPGFKPQGPVSLYGGQDATDRQIY